MKKHFLFIILCVLGLSLTVVAYSNHFHNAFQFDDDHTIVNNLFIRDLKNIPSIFTDPGSFSSLPGKQSRPLTTVSFAIDYWLGGGLKSTFYFHLTTFIWHIILLVLLFLLYRNLMDQALVHEWNRYIALFASVWFGVHTANAETVNYICQRADILSTLSVTAGLVIYMYFPAWRKFGLYLLPVFAGLMIKESTVMFAPVIFCYIFLFEKRLSLSEALRPSNIFSILKSSLPAIILCAVASYLILTLTISVRSTGNISRIHYLMTQPFVIVHYFLTFFLPFNLSADTDWTAVTNAFDDRLIVGVIFISIMLYIAYRTSINEKSRPVSFGILWFFIALLPTSSFFPFAEVMNDHRMFFPFAGLTLSVCWAAGLLIIRLEDKIRQSAFLKTAIIILSFAVLSSHAYGTHQRNKVWHTAESLWHDVTVKSPNNGRGLMNYGITQMEKGNYQTAQFYFEKALIQVPYYSYLHINLGILKNEMKQPEEAEKYFRNAILYDPNNTEAYYFYAKWLNDRNRSAEAIQLLEKLIKLSPAHGFGSAMLSEIKRNPGKAINPVNEAEKTIRASQSPENYLNLSLQYHRAGRYSDSIKACKEALKLKPDYDLAYNNMCAAYNDMNLWDKAVDACERGLRINPDNQLMKNNLARALNEKARHSSSTK